MDNGVFVPWYNRSPDLAAHCKLLTWLNVNVGRQHWHICGPGSTHPHTIRFDYSEDATAFGLMFNVTDKYVDNITKWDYNMLTKADVERITENVLRQLTIDVEVCQDNADGREIVLKFNKLEISRTFFSVATE